MHMQGPGFPKTIVHVQAAILVLPGCTKRSRYTSRVWSVFLMRGGRTPHTESVYVLSMQCQAQGLNIAMVLVITAAALGGNDGGNGIT